MCGIYRTVTQWIYKHFRRLRGELSVFGCFLVHLTLGTIFTIGNMNPYITSYIRARSSPRDLTMQDSVWIFSTAAMGQGISMFFGGLINSKIGPRWTALLGAWFMSLGVLLTFFTVKVNFALTICTYGIMFGLGVGIAYAPPLACSMKWFPEKKGLVNGIVLAGFGGGAFIFNQIQTAFINPNNVSPDVDKKYFSDKAILDRVPYCCLMLGGCYAILQMIGCILIASPPAETQAVQVHIDEEDVTQPLIKEESEVAGSDISVNNPAEPTEENVLQDVHPFKVLKTRAFYTLWFMFLLNGQGVVFISSLYKTFGQTFINDDRFLALVGAFSSVFNAGGRVFWGHLADRFSFRTAMLCLCTGMIALMMTLIATPHGGKPMFFIWICGIFMMFCGNFSLFPTAIAKCFGPKYVAINYGLLFTSQAVTGPIGAILATSLNDLIGWFGMFSLVSGCSFIALVLTFSFNMKKSNGEDI